MALSDSYSSLERRFLEPGRKLLLLGFRPFTAVLAALGVPPNAVSLSQILLGLLIVVIVPSRPRLAFLLFIASLLLDGLDGALARRTGRASPFGALLDQFCDHTRETLVIAALARTGALAPFPATIYAFTYVASNLTLYLCNHHRVPLPVAIKSYLVVYPALFLYLWWGHNLLDKAVSLSVVLMWLVIVQGLFHLRRALGNPPPC